MNLLWFVAGIVVGLVMGMVITCAIVQNKDLTEIEREENDIDAW